MSVNYHEHVGERHSGLKGLRERAEKKLGPKVVKGLIYAFSRFILIFVLIMVLFAAFDIGMNSMNIYTMVKDGFSLRAECVMQPSAEDEEKLTSYFTQNFLNTDEMLNSDIFDDYDVTNYYERVDVGSVIAWPWMDKVTVTIVEQVMDISGTYSGEYLREHNLTEDDIKKDDIVMPSWKNGEYRITLVRPSEEGESWLVDSIEYVSPAEDKMMKEYDKEEETTETDGDTGEENDAAGGENAPAEQQEQEGTGGGVSLPAE